MTLHYAMMDAEGVYPLRFGIGRALPPGSVALPDGLTAEAAAEMMVVEGEWVARPRIPAPAIGAGPPVTVAFTGLPAGAKVIVRDLDTGDTLATEAESGGVIDFSFVDAGPYWIETAALKPWLDWEGEVVVP